MAAEQSFPDLVLMQAKEDYESATKNRWQKKWREKAYKEFDFVAGGDGEDSGHWTEEDLDLLRERKQPPVTFNVTEKLIEGLSGVEINNRQEVAYKPREPTDTGLAGALTEIGKWMRDNDVEEEDSDAFRNALICGMGATVASLAYDEDPDGRYQQVSVDPLGLRWDVRARRPNLSDARWIGFVSEWDRDRAHEEFGRDANLSASIFGDQDPLESRGDEPSEYPTDYNDPAIQDRNEPPSTVAMVFEYQFYRLEPFYRISHPDGRMSESIDGETFAKMQDEAKINGIPFVDQTSSSGPLGPGEVGYLKQQKRAYYRAFFSGDRMLGEPEVNPYRDGFSILPITGRRDHNKGTFYGVVRAMLDPQRFTDKFLSDSIYHYSTAIKGAMKVGEDALANPEAAEGQITAPNGMVTMAQGKFDQLQPLPPTPFPPMLPQLLQVAMDAPPNVTGVSEEFIGIASRDQPIGLEQTRKLATLSIAAPIFSSYRKYRKAQGRLILAFMKDYIPESSMARVTSAQAKQFVPTIKNLDAHRFDIHVDDAPLSPSMKSTVYSVMKDFLQFVPPQLHSAYIPEFLDYSPLPADMVAALKKTIAAAGAPSPMQRIGEILTLVERAMKIRDTDADAAMKLAQAEHLSGQASAEQDKLDLKAQDQVMNLLQTMLQMGGRPEATPGPNGSGQ